MVKQKSTAKYKMMKLRNNWFIFKDKLATNIYLSEEIVYYDKTKTLTISSFFQWDKRRVDYQL